MDKIIKTTEEWWAEICAKQQAEIDHLKAVIEDLKSEIEGLHAEIEEWSREARA